MISDPDGPPPFPAVGELKHFLMTGEHQRFAEFCDACARHRYIGLCYGAPGVGKTLSARRYARWDTVEATLEAPCPRNEGRRVPAELLGAHTLLYSASVMNTPRMVERELQQLRQVLVGLFHQARDQFSVVAPRQDIERRDAFIRLVIVDEADRLKEQSLEQLRQLYDQRPMGLVLIGMPGIEKRLARYAQLYSRVGFVHRFRALAGKEFRSVLARKWAAVSVGDEQRQFSDEEAIAAAVRITSGNFRLLERLFDQVVRILEINQLQAVTREVVEAARENLVIGATA